VDISTEPRAQQGYALDIVQTQEWHGWQATHSPFLSWGLSLQGALADPP